MQILNGRVLGDLQGQFTSVRYNCCSVIDYCFVNNEFCNSIEYFKVLDHTHLSDHAPITVCLNIKSKIIRGKDNKCYNKFHIGLRCNEECYTEAFNLKQFQDRVHVMCPSDYCKNVDGINSLCKELTSVITDAAKCSLKWRFVPQNTRINIKQVK